MSRVSRTRSWWHGTLLVARRGLLETVRSKTFRVVTGVLLLAAVVSVAVPVVLSGRTTTYTLATVGPAPAPMRATLTAAARHGDFAVQYLARPDGAQVRTAVVDGDATAGLVGDTLYTSVRGSGVFAAVVSQAVVAQETARLLAAAGLDEAQVAAVAAVRPPEQVAVGGALDEGRAGVGFAVGIVLYIAITMAGTAIATTVATEKSARISEVLLAVLRPSQALVGTVLAVGVVTLGQLLLLATPLAVTSAFTDAVSLPSATGGDLALGVAWFVLGFGLYAFAFAATAALVDKVTDVSGATTIVTMTLVLAYLAAILQATRDDVVSTALSIFPVTAPLSMPIRWASGQVPVYQLVLAMTLTAATVAVVLVLASRLYGRALLITGHRVRFRELRRT